MLLGFSAIINMCEVLSTMGISICCCDHWYLEKKGMIEEGVQGITRACVQGACEIRSCINDKNSQPGVPCNDWLSLTINPQIMWFIF